MKKEKWDFAPENKEFRKILQTLEKFILKNYGEPCKFKAMGCIRCKVWAIYDLFKLELF